MDLPEWVLTEDLQGFFDAFPGAVVRSAKNLRTGEIVRNPDLRHEGKSGFAVGAAVKAEGANPNGVTAEDIERARAIRARRGL